MNIPEQLLATGWREYQDQFSPHARHFCKRYDTPTKCACNDSKEGAQISIYVSRYMEIESIEMDVCGELADGTWVKLLNYGLPKDLPSALALIPRMLAMWECAASLSVAKAEEAKL